MWDGEARRAPVGRVVRGLADEDGTVMTRRRLPRPSELAPYLRTGPVRLSPVERRLAGAATIADLRAVARRHVPRAVFDYVDGAAETETSLARSRAAYGRV